MNPDEFDESKNPFAVFSKRLNTMLPFNIVNDIQEIISNTIVKVVYISEKIENIISAQKDIKHIEGIEAYRVGKGSLDIVTKGVSKGQVLIDYAKSLGIDPNEIIAIGDSENDLSMLEVVGFPVTLENGEQALKEMASLITSSNNEAGVAKALKKIYKYDEGSDKYDGI